MTRMVSDHGESPDSGLEGQQDAQEHAQESSRPVVHEQVSTVAISERDENGKWYPAHGGMLLNRPPVGAGALSRPPASPTARLREAMRAGLERLLPQLIEDIASGKLSRLQGADLLAKYGIGATGTVTIVSPDVLQRLERQVQLIASRPTWDAGDLLAELREVWT